MDTKNVKNTYYLDLKFIGQKLKYLMEHFTKEKEEKQKKIFYSKKGYKCRQKVTNLNSWSRYETLKRVKVLKVK